MSIEREGSTLKREVVSSIYNIAARGYLLWLDYNNLFPNADNPDCFEIDEECKILVSKHHLQIVLNNELPAQMYRPKIGTSVVLTTFYEEQDLRATIVVEEAVGKEIYETAYFLDYLDRLTQSESVILSLDSNEEVPEDIELRGLLEELELMRNALDALLNPRVVLACN